jgi:transposase InsO family protein
MNYTQRLAEASLVPSVGSVGDSYDNALAETINGLYKPRSSGASGHGPTHRQWKWPPCAGSTGTTTTAFSAPSVTSPAEAEANYYAARGTLDMVA